MDSFSLLVKGQPEHGMNNNLSVSEHLLEPRAHHQSFRTSPSLTTVTRTIVGRETMNFVKTTALAAILLTGTASLALAQSSGSTVGTGGTTIQNGTSSSTIGTGGSAAGTGDGAGSASTLGTGGTSAGGGTSSSSVGTGGSAAGTGDGAGSASTLGTGGTSAGGGTSSSSVGTGGSAASAAQDGESNKDCPPGQAKKADGKC
jgi:hypothetical protein